MLASEAALVDFNNLTVLPVTFSMSQQIFVYCETGSFSSIAKIRIPKKEIGIMLSEYFIVEEEKSIKLFTFTLFTPKKCFAAQFVEVNSFDKDTGRWLHGTFKVDKVSNFRGCQLNFVVFKDWPFYLPLEIDNEKRDVTKCAGIFCGVLRDFSSALNFTYHTNIYQLETAKYMWPGIPSHLVMGCASLDGLVVYDEKRNENTLRPEYYSRPLMYTDTFIAIPPGEEYDGYEKLVLPFDEPTWMWISITFAAAFLTIFLLKFAKPKVVNFMIGSETLTPVLNVIRAFFGISQIVCPRRNFARYLLMMFILFSLIIRTAYQGEMFEFLQKDMRKPTVTSYEEMIDQGFVFYMPADFREKYPNTEIAKR